MGSFQMKFFWFMSCGAICLLLGDQMYPSLPSTLDYTNQGQQESAAGLRQFFYPEMEVMPLITWTTKSPPPPPQQQPQQETIGTTTLRERPARDQRSQEMNNNKKNTKSRGKPWKSTPPTPISLMNTTDDYVKHRHSCIQAIRDRHQETFKDFLLVGDDKNGANREVVLVDPAYHKNVGDHMLTLGEIRLIEEAFKLPRPQQCHYRQAQNFVAECEEVLTQGSSLDPKVGKVALWHGGGNWGDIWGTYVPFVATSL